MKTEKHYYKLADYFCTIGLDNYYTPEEVYKTDDGKRDSIIGPDGIPIAMEGVTASNETINNATIDQQR